MKAAEWVKCGAVVWVWLNAIPVGAAEMYKWEDADGTVHYGSARPKDATSIGQVSYFEEQSNLERLQAELTRARLAAEGGGQASLLPVQNQSDDPRSYGHWWMFERPRSSNANRPLD